MVRHPRESGDFSRSRQEKNEAPKGIRVAKALARAGIASRREVERLIGLGKVALNGRILDTPAQLVTHEDVLTVDGHVVGTPEPTRLWRYHKPVGLVTTHKDPHDRPTVFQSLPEGLPRVISVGRLDLNSEGLLLLTNDGELARALELPSSGWVRRYRARALGNITQDRLDTLKDGITVEGIHYGSIEAVLDKAEHKADGRANLWITVTLTEGKNREVRKVLEALGLKVNRLIRLSYGPFVLGDLGHNEVEEVGPRVIREILDGVVEASKLPSVADPVRPALRTLSRPPRPGVTRGRRPGSDSQDGDRRDQREGYQPRLDLDADAGADAPRFKPRGEGFGRPRFERSESGFRPRREGDDRGGFKPRGEGRFEGRGERSEGGFKPRREGEGGGFRPRREGGDDRGGFKPRGEGRFEGRGERSEGGFKPRREGEGGGFRPRREGDDRGGFKPRGEGRFEGRGERSEGGFKPRREGSDDRGGFKPRGEGRFEGRGDRSEGRGGEGRPFKKPSGWAKASPKPGHKPGGFKPRSRD